MNNNQWWQQQQHQQQQQRQRMMGAEWERRQREKREQEFATGIVEPSPKEKSCIGRAFSIIFYLVVLYIIFYFVMEVIG